MRLTTIEDFKNHAGEQVWTVCSKLRLNIDGTQTNVSSNYSQILIYDHITWEDDLIRLSRWGTISKNNQIVESLGYVRLPVILMERKSRYTMNGGFPKRILEANQVNLVGDDNIGGLYVYTDEEEAIKEDQERMEISENMKALWTNMVYGRICDTHRKENTLGVLEKFVRDIREEIVELDDLINTRVTSEKLSRSLGYMKLRKIKVLKTILAKEQKIKELFEKYDGETN